MGTIGDCYDNGQMESFWIRMQVELLNRKRWNTRFELANHLSAVNAAELRRMQRSLTNPARQTSTIRHRSLR
jgi:hypothetical protein